ncbi:expressed unknown protein [Seminavis robusta]|uniref:Cyanovirin-N domain-containing protein n=1 Tax=Seminavis robusta TaxID=568900 RepID=A0A9N8EMB8_9STRA|nr:expressed unknown protein [Seminavis robusta]|eukprot:Sro1328_g263240.1 n/a (204) ;mRNA; r:27666-28277
MQCPKGCGKKLATQIVAIDACAAFGNDNGVLVCDDGSGVDEDSGGLLLNDDDIPSGSYQESCRGCKMLEESDGSEDTRIKFLSCSACKSWNGAFLASTIRNFDRCSDIDNQNGELVCKDDQIPPGAYRESCSLCELTVEDPKTLSCQCRDSSGGRQLAVLSPPDGEWNFDSCHNIDNHDGNLVCQRQDDDTNDGASRTSRDEL